jgi:septation ring formation regulator EzrA
MSPELGAALVGFVIAITALVKQITDKVKMAKQYDTNTVKMNEEIAILKTKVSEIEKNSSKQDIRFSTVESELKAINATLNQLIGMLKGKGL